MGDTKGFRGEGRHESFIEPEYEGDTTNNLIAIGDPVESANSARGIIELGKVSGNPTEPKQEGSRIVSSKGKPGFRWQCGVRAFSQGDG